MRKKIVGPANDAPEEESNREEQKDKGLNMTERESKLPFKQKLTFADKITSNIYVEDETI